MRKQRIILGSAALLVVGALALGGCAPSAQPAGSSTQAAAEQDSVAANVMDTGLRPLADWQLGGVEPEEWRDAIYGAYEDRIEDWPTNVITFEDGVTVRRTPFPARDTTANLKNNISFNTYRLNAEDRGCWACHEDLAELVQTIGDAPHEFIASSLGMETTVSQCIDCHNSHLGGRYESNFSGMIHTIHGSRNKMFDAQGGDCWSCHYGVTAESGIGKSSLDEEGLHLWDEVKHNVLRGITTFAADKFDGSFSVDQDFVEGPEAPMWTNFYVKNRDDMVTPTNLAMTDEGQQPDPANDGVFDSWEITLKNDGGEERVYTLQELIDTVGGEEVTMGVSCLNNGENGPYVSNRVIKGIPLVKLAELVGAQDKTLVEALGQDGTKKEFGLDYVKEYSGYLVYEISGQPVTYMNGYPCQVWLGGWIADENIKAVTEIEFMDGEWKPSLWREGDFSKKEGTAGYAPNVGIAYMREGQIFDLGETVTFQGFANTYVHQISDVEFSMDHGQTWKTFETADQDPTKWTWWNFEWTPEAEGSYCFMVRAHDTGGYETPEPAEIMVNVVDPSKEG